WLGFTLPSAALMTDFALGLGFWGNVEGAGWVAGLKIAAVAVVAHAVWSMAVKLCPDWQRVLIALAGAALLIVAQDAALQLLVIVLGGLAGWIIYRHRAPAPASDAGQAPARHRSGWPFLLGFALLLGGLPLAAQAWP